MGAPRDPRRPRGRQPQIWLRISQQVLDDLDALVPLVQQHPNFRAGTVTMQDVARLALSRGIEALKQELEGREGTEGGARPPEERRET